MSAGVGVIGCGYWGRNLVRVFYEIGVLAAVCDADPKVADQFARKYSVPAHNLDGILSDNSINAVAIAAPASQHADLTSHALSAGKDVFVEKPIALQTTDAEELIAVAAKQDRVLMVGHLLQYHPAFLKLQELVVEGRLGRIQYIYSHRLNLGKIRREESVFWSFAPHDISMILRLTGEMPTSVSANGASYLHTVIADITNTYMSFPSGVNAHIFVSWLHPYKEQKLVVVGSDGMAVFDDTKGWDDKLQYYAHRVGWRDGAPELKRVDAEPIGIEEAEPLKLECEHFIQCVSSRSVPRTNGEEGLGVLRILEAADRSLYDEQRKTIVSPGAKMRTATATLGNDSQGLLHQVRIPDAGEPSTAFPGVFVHESSYIDSGCVIGPGTKIWHFSHILEGSRIGADCTIGQNVMIGPGVTVEDHCKIQNNVSIYKGVTLKEGVFCGPSCVFTNVINPRSEIARKDEFRDTLVGKGASIGANATIVCGNQLGEYCFVAAGAVVTRDVPAYALVAGVPARRIGWMSPAGGRLGESMVCPRTGKRFEERNGVLMEVPVS